MTTYHLTLSQRHAHVMRDALDFYLRVMGLGQVEEVEWHWRAHDKMDDQFEAKSATIKDACNTIKAAGWGYAPNQSSSIRSEEVPADYRVAYDMVQRLRLRMSDVAIARAEAEGKHDIVRHMRSTVDRHDYSPTCPDVEAMGVEVGPREGE